MTLPFFYDISIRFWTCTDSVVLFVFQFFILILTYRIFNSMWFGWFTWFAVTALVDGCYTEFYYLIFLKSHHGELGVSHWEIVNCYPVASFVFLFDDISCLQIIFLLQCGWIYGHRSTHKILSYNIKGKKQKTKKQKYVNLWLFILL